MPREIRLNAFEMNCVGHQSPGLWRHPKDRAWQYKDLEYWTDLAKLLERGKFDGIFIADVIGIYDVLGGNGDAAIRQATQVPVNDPLALITPMALVTEHLGFGLTASLTFEHPYPFARRLSTLDHLTKGRIGWNIVTSYLDSGARNLGQKALSDHDARYDYADEYLQVLYKLFEGSWEDDAVLRDRERGVFSDPRKVHEIRHHGKHFQVPGIHLCEPSPQRTPVLYQAGSSPRGRQFAATHAECVFVNGQKKDGVREIVTDIRARAVGLGRHGDDIKVFLGATIVTGRTEHIRAHAVFALTCFVATRVAKVHQGVQVRISHGKNMPAATTVPAVGTAEFLVLFVPKRHAAIATITGGNVNKGFIDELHGISSLQKGAAPAADCLILSELRNALQAPSADDLSAIVQTKQQSPGKAGLRWLPEE